MRVSRPISLVLAGVLATSMLMLTPATSGGSIAAPASSSLDRAEKKKKKAPSYLKVGSFNIKSAKLDTEAKGNHKPWKIRKPYVARDIKQAQLDVVGLQEATWQTQPTQWQDLINELAKRGRKYAATNDDPAASAGERIIYNTATVAVVKEGSYKYKAQRKNKEKRTTPYYMNWAIFKVLATGKTFFFSNTHLAHRERNVQVKQWNELIAKIKQLKGNRPVVHVGDHQSGRNSRDGGAKFVKKMRRAGFGDVVGLDPGEYKAQGLRAKKIINGRVNSVNHFDRTPPMQKPGFIQSFIDWICVTNKLKVLNFKVWARLKKGRIKGVIPSDHFLVSSVIQLSK